MTFHEWMTKVDDVLEGAVGMSHLCLGDAPYRDMYDDEVEPRHAAATALVDWNDFAVDDLEEVGLGDAY